MGSVQLLLPFNMVSFTFGVSYVIFPYMRILYNFELDKDFVELYKTNKNKTELKQIKIDEDLVVLKDKNDKLHGVRLNKVFHENVRLGLSKEIEFKNYLDKNNFPYLYIAQSPEGLDKSESLFEADCKRPDFLVNVNNVSTMFVDVKARTPISFLEEECFCIEENDIKKLYKLKNSFHIPLTVAFCSKANSDFFFIQIDEIYKYTEYLKEHKIDNNLMIRIPKFFLTKSLLDAPVNCDKKNSEIEKNAIEVNTIVKDFREKSINIIQNKYVTKTDFINLQKENYKTILFENEIKNLFDTMVSENIIIHYREEPLSINKIS